MEVGRASDPAFRGPYEGQTIFNNAKPDRPGDCPLHRHRRQHRSEQLSSARANAQSIKGGKVSNRHNEACNDRDGQDAIGNGNVEECHHRNPDDIEDGNGYADAFGAEPIKPAKRKLALLLAGEAAAARKEAAPMFFQDLEAAVSPTVPLLLVSFKAVRQQAAAITPVGIMSLPAEFKQRQSKVGVPGARS